MADHEIYLPRSRSQILNTEAEQQSPVSQEHDDDSASPAICSTPLHLEKDDETFDDTDKPFSQKSSKTDVEPPIVWHYLTFETDLPSPSRTNGYEVEMPPPCPDLNKYQSPFDWPKPRKNFIISLSCVSTFIAAYSSGAYAPGVGQMTEEWNVSTVACLVGIAIFTAGFGVAPMILAPFSEINGRKPVFIATGILFVICQLCCGLTPSFGGMLISRFLVGVGGSTFSTMVGGVVSDIYQSKDRNAPMALFSGAALAGTGAGPLVAGHIAQHISWRWIFYSQAIFNAIVVLAVGLFFKETRGSVLLSWKAKALNKWYEARERSGHWSVDLALYSSKPDIKTQQRIRWKVKSDEERTSLLTSIKISIVRPFQLLIHEPVVFWFSLWVSFSWGILYLTIAAVPLVFQTTYGFNVAQADSVFTAMVVGGIISTLVSIYQEVWFDAWVIRNSPPSAPPKHRLSRFLVEHAGTPEKRLFFPCVESLCLVIGLFMFGWTGLYPGVPWIFPAIAIGFATCGIFSIYLAVFNYLADAYQMYASSALAAQSFCRNLIGGSFPLITTQMYTKLGFGGASSMLGGVGLALTVVPWVLVAFGPRIRARSKFATALEKST